MLSHISISWLVFTHKGRINYKPIQNFLKKHSKKIKFTLPTGFCYSRDLTFMGKSSETNSAHGEFSQIALRSSTNLAAINFSY
jgi:hypothetical protein